MAKTKIKENPDLVKDTTTGAVINTNSNAFARRRAQMALQIEKDNKIVPQENTQNPK